MHKIFRFSTSVQLKQYALKLNACVCCLVRTDTAIDKIQLEIQAGSRAAFRIIQLVTLVSEEDDDSIPDDVVQTKLKKILGIENIFKVTDLV